MDDLRKKTRDMIDALHDRLKDCQAAMLIDQETGLVLSKSAGTPTSQTKIEQISADALAELRAPSVAALRSSATEPELMAVTRIGKLDVMVVVQDLSCGDDALVCLFRKQPNRAYLLEVAAEIFQLPMKMEAA